MKSLPKFLAIILTIALLAIIASSMYKKSLTQESDSMTQSTETYSDISTEIVTYHDDVTGYLAKPAEEGTYPALILIHEWWGLNENIKDFAERFARQGYVALAVDLYNGEVATDREGAGALAGAVRADLEPAFANLEDAVAYLKAREDVNPESLGSVGWCFGGGWSYEMAVNNLGVNASIMYYGQFDPEDDFEHMRSTILGHFGEEDRSILVDDVNEFAAVLETLPGDHAVYVYPNAGHAFANEDNEEAYNQEAADTSWTRTLEFLEKHL